MKTEKQIYELIAILSMGVRALDGTQEQKSILKSLDMLLWVADLPNKFDEIHQQLLETLNEGGVDIEQLSRSVAEAKEQFEKMTTGPMVSTGIPKSKEELFSMLKSGEIRSADEEAVNEAEFVLCGLSKPDAIRASGAEDVPCNSCGVMVIRSPNSPKDKPCLCRDCGEKHLGGERMIKE